MRVPCEHSGSTEAGFTFLEVMVALAVVAALMVTLIYTTNHNLDVAGRHEALTVATMLARDKMTELSTGPQKIKDKKGNFPDPFEDYEFSIILKEKTVFVVYFNIEITEVTVDVKGLGEEVSLRKIFPKGKVS